MSARAEQAVQNKKNGMNCAQAVASAFVDYTDIDHDTLMAMTQTFGAGIGATLEGTCGAVTGASLILGLSGKANDRMTNMKAAGTLVRSFKAQNGSVTCRELKGVGSGVVLRACNDCVRDAAEILEELLDKSAKE